jgi:hypothetical protein
LEEPFKGKDGSGLLTAPVATPHILSGSRIEHPTAAFDIEVGCCIRRSAGDKRQHEKTKHDASLVFHEALHFPGDWIDPLDRRWVSPQEKIAFD